MTNSERHTGTQTPTVPPARLSLQLIDRLTIGQHTHTHTHSHTRTQTHTVPPARLSLELIDRRTTPERTSHITHTITGYLFDRCILCHARLVELHLLQLQQIWITPAKATLTSKMTRTR